MDKETVKTEKKNIALIAFRTISNSSFNRSLVFSLLLFFGFYLIWTPIYYFIWKDYDVLFFPTPNETIMQLSFGRQLLEAVILAPLIETFFTQKLVYHLFSLSPWLKQHHLLMIILGALLFGLIHFYSISYIIYNFFIGALLMYTYISYIDKNPYWLVVVLHGCTNLFALLIDPVEKSVFNLL